MKRTLLFMCICFLGFAAFSQAERNPEVEQEVNEQLWKPFKISWEQRDAKAFNDLHTDDVLRISKWGGVKIGNEYKDRIIEAYKRPDDRKRTIDFWLEHRYYSGDTGYEVGYLKIVTQEEGKENRYSYSRFHVVLKKIDGQWKIAQDWDTNNINGIPVTAEDYEKGIQLDLNY